MFSEILAECHILVLTEIDFIDEINGFVRISTIFQDRVYQIYQNIIDIYKENH